MGERAKECVARRVPAELMTLDADRRELSVRTALGGPSCDCPDFELGAVPPFGGREDWVIVDERLAARDSVVLEAGSHDRSVRLKVADLVRLTSAQIADITREPAAG